MSDDLKKYQQDMKGYIKGLTQDFHKEIVGFKKEIKVEFQKQTKALTEHFDFKVSVIGEQYGSITADLGSIKERLTSLEEDVGTLKVDMAIVKSDVFIIKTELEVVKDMLTYKADQEEHAKLTARVYALEHRGQVG